MTEEAKMCVEWLNHYIKTDPAHKVIAHYVFGHNGDCGDYGEDWMWLDDICKQVINLIESMSAQLDNQEAAIDRIYKQCIELQRNLKELGFNSIAEMSAQLDQATRERDAAKDINVHTQPKWISVKERLPEPFVSVLVHIPEEEPLPQVHEGYITPDGTWCSVLYVETYDRVAHWMPMPEMPEEGE